jgi:prepilin-type processing-associated H-X9-DG protein
MGLVNPAYLMGIFAPAMSRARGNAGQIGCLSNMRQIGIAMMIYSQEHKGNLPPDLGSLLEYAATPQLFICPSDNNHAAMVSGSDEQKAAWVNANSSYILLAAGGNLRHMRGAEDVVLYEKAHYHGDKMNLLYADGHSVSASISQAEHEIEQSKQRLAAGR